MKKIFFTFLGFIIASLLIEVVILITTKVAGWDNFTQGRPFLAIVHTHLMVLGAFFFLIQMLLEKTFGITDAKLYNIFYFVYLIGVTLLVTMMLYKGFVQLNDGATVISGLTQSITPIAHVLVFSGFFLFAYCLYTKAVKPYMVKKQDNTLSV